MPLSGTSSRPDSSLPGTCPPSACERTRMESDMQWDISYISFLNVGGTIPVRSGSGGPWNSSTSRAFAHPPRDKSPSDEPLADDVHDVLVDMLMNHTLGPGSRLNIDALAKTLRYLADPRPRGAGEDRSGGPDREGPDTRLPRGAPDQPREPALPDRFSIADGAGSGRRSSPSRRQHRKPPTCWHWPTAGAPTTAMTLP